MNTAGSPFRRVFNKILIKGANKQQNSHKQHIYTCESCLGGEGGIRTHVPLRTTAFRVRYCKHTLVEKR